MAVVDARDDSTKDGGSVGVTERVVDEEEGEVRISISRLGVTEPGNKSGNKSDEGLDSPECR